MKLQYSKIKQSLIFCCYLIICLFMLLAYSPTLYCSDELPNRETPVVKCVKEVGPAVVNISTERILTERINPFGDPFLDRFFGDFFNVFPQRSFKQESLGSGVIISPEGYILTNEHVILKASTIHVTLSDKREFEAKLIGADPKSDLAVIKINAKEALPFIKMGRSDDLMIGETVIAIGNPFGLSHTVTTGVISALDRTVKLDEDRVYKDFIQTDASINPGNSGGPLLNIRGELVGINTAIYQKAEGIGFAIPINRAKRIVEDLIHYGEVHNAWIGLNVQSLDESLVKYFNLQKREGVIVTKVFNESPAKKAGIEMGDIIVEIGNQKIETREDYFSIISGYTAKDKVHFKILRNESYLEITFKASEIPVELADGLSRDWLGIKFRDITKSDVQRYGLSNTKGVIITEIIRGGTAYQAGIRPGDVIRQVNNIIIENEKGFKNALVTAAAQEGLLLMVQRGPFIYPVILQP